MTGQRDGGVDGAMLQHPGVLPWLGRSAQGAVPCQDVGTLGTVSGDTGYSGVLCCTRLSDLGTMSWDTQGCCAVSRGKTQVTRL